MMLLADLVRSGPRLWSEAPRWRWTVVAAMLCTVGYLLPDTSVSVPPRNTVPTPPNRGPLGQGGAAQTPVAPPSLTPVRPEDLAARNRLETFYQAATSNGLPADKGHRCEVQMDALRQLRPSDRALAKPAQGSKFDEVKAACELQLAASDQRLRLAAASMSAYRAAPGVTLARRVSQAFRAFDEFDRGRSPAAMGGAIKDFADVDSAVARLDDLLTRVGAAAPLFRSGDPASLDAATTLAGLAKELSSLPFAAALRDGDAPEAAILEPAWRAQRDLTEADAKIGVVQTALARVASDPKGLALALATLSDFARARARAEGVDLAAARAAAKSTIPSVLGPLAGRYRNPGSRTRTDADALLGLAQISEELGAPLEPDAETAVKDARADVAGSINRLKHLRAAASAWRQHRPRGGRDGEVEQRIQDVVHDLTRGLGGMFPFDVAGSGDAERTAFETVLLAKSEIDARIAPGLPRRTLRVAIDIGPSVDRSTVNALRDALVGGLSKSFTIVSDRTDANIVLQIIEATPSPTGADFNSQFGRRVVLQGNLLWTYSRVVADLGRRQGEAHNSNPGRAIAEAAAEAASDLIGTVDAIL